MEVNRDRNGLETRDTPAETAHRRGLGTGLIIGVVCGGIVGGVIGGIWGQRTDVVPPNRVEGDATPRRLMAAPETTPPQTTNEPGYQAERYAPGRETER